DRLNVDAYRVVQAAIRRRAAAEKAPVGTGGDEAGKVVERVANYRTLNAACLRCCPRIRDAARRKWCVNDRFGNRELADFVGLGFGKPDIAVGTCSDSPSRGIRSWRDIL